MSKRSKACDISPKVKKKVWERDNHCCITMIMIMEIQE